MQIIARKMFKYLHNNNKLQITTQQVNRNLIWDHNGNWFAYFYIINRTFNYSGH